VNVAALVRDRVFDVGVGIQRREQRRQVLCTDLAIDLQNLEIGGHLLLELQPQPGSGAQFADTIGRRRLPAPLDDDLVGRRGDFVPERAVVFG
jgi:hypothetical protein